MNQPAYEPSTAAGDHTLVLGIGNTLLSDEGVGVHTVTRLRARHGELPRVEWMDGGTLSFSLAAAIEDAARLIVVDAAQLHAPPGTVRVFVDSKMDQFLAAPGRRSVHEVGLIDLISMVRLCRRLPSPRALIGIQPLCTDWGEQPSEAVAANLFRAENAVAALIEEWHQ